jgi:hypothetical protein
MPPSRIAAVAVLSLRIAYGLGLLAVPARLTRRWLGVSSEQAGTQVAVRGLGIRETLLHVGAVSAAASGRPVRPWLAASIVGDLTDIAATTAARRGLPDRAPRATAAVAGGSALLSGALVAVVDE